MLFSLIRGFFRCIIGLFIRHATLPAIEVEKLVDHDVDGTLLNAMNDPACGTFVHWGIEGSGKSISAARVARKLKDESKRSILFINGDSLSGGVSSSLIQAFCKVLPTREKSVQADISRPPPTTIIIDDFDRGSFWGEELKKSIVSLSRISASGRRFNVLLLVNSSSRASEILNWDWRNIQLVGAPGCGIWTREHISRFLGPGYDPTVFDQCLRAGTPSFAKWCTKGTPPTIGRMRFNAERCALEWEKGRAELMAFC